MCLYFKDVTAFKFALSLLKIAWQAHSFTVHLNIIPKSISHAGSSEFSAPQFSNTKLVQRVIISACQKTGSQEQKTDWPDLIDPEIVLVFVYPLKSSSRGKKISLLVLLLKYWKMSTGIYWECTMYKSPWSFTSSC